MYGKCQLWPAVCHFIFVQFEGEGQTFFSTATSSNNTKLGRTSKPSLRICWLVSFISLVLFIGSGSIFRFLYRRVHCAHFFHPNLPFIMCGNLPPLPFSVRLSGLNIKYVYIHARKSNFCISPMTKKNACGCNSSTKIGPEKSESSWTNTPRWLGWVSLREHVALCPVVQCGRV